MSQLCRRNFNQKAKKYTAIKFWNEKNGVTKNGKKWKRRHDQSKSSKIPKGKLETNLFGKTNISYKFHYPFG
jgi:hypothetical protein